jgi:hypothetical protein
MLTSERSEQKGELVQEYVRTKWSRAGSADRAEAIGQRLGSALRSRIDALGTDGEKLLEVVPASIIQKLEELERQAAIEDQGMLKRGCERYPDAESMRSRTPIRNSRFSRSSKHGGRGR